MYTALNKAGSQKHDFDVIAKVLNVFDKDEYTNELKLRDNSGASFFTLALKLKFPHIKAGEVVRVRSAQFDATSHKNVLNLSHFSNILELPGSSKLAKDLSKVSEDKKADAAALKSATMAHPVVLTEIDKKH